MASDGPQTTAERPLLHIAQVKGDTMAEHRAAVWKTPLPGMGDAVLIWVNERDLFALAVAGKIKDVTDGE